MKKALFTFIVLMMTVVIDSTAQNREQETTLKKQMEVLHHQFGINFVYDSSIDLDIPCSSKRLANIEYLSEYLRFLLKDSEIQFEIKSKYVIITRKNSKHKSKDYVILVEEQKDTLDESLITAFSSRRNSSRQIGLKSINANKFRKGFSALSTPDIIKEIQNYTGVSGGTELLSGMYVHGGDGTDNLFLINGVPLYQISHMAGLTSSFNTEIVQNMDFYKSCFPAYYGGKLSSVTDIKTKTGDMNKYHGSFNIGVLNGGLQFEGPIIPGKMSFSVGLRRSWYDILTAPALAIYNRTHKNEEQYKLRYAMTDLNVSVTYLYNKENILSLDVYTGSDFARYGRMRKEEKVWWDVRYTGNNGFDLKSRWGNVLVSANWEKIFSENFHLNTLAYYTRANNKVEFYRSEWQFINSSAGTKEKSITEKNKGTLDDLSVKSDLYWHINEQHKLRTGANLTLHLFHPYRDIMVIDKTQESNSEIENNEAVVSQDSFCESFVHPEFSTYIEDEIKIADWLNANIGLRYVLFGTNGGAEHSLEPRAAISFNLSPKSSLRFSYSEMSQFIHNLSANYIDIPMSSWMPSTNAIPPMRSRQITGGFHTNGKSVSFSIEGFWRQMNNLTEYIGMNSIYPNFNYWEDELVTGMGHSYGMEIELGYSGEKTSASACYTLSWSERFFSSIWHSWYPARNDNRNKLTVNMTHKFSKKFEIYAGWNYHTGNRMTVPTQFIDEKMYYTSPYNYKLPDYHRLDLGCNFHRKTRRGHDSTWNVSLYNAYFRMNPLFALFDRYQDGTVWINEIKTYAAVPIIPSFSYTLRF